MAKKGGKKGGKSSSAAKKGGTPEESSSSSPPSSRNGKKKTTTRQGKGKKRGKHHKNQWNSSNSATEEDNKFRKLLQQDGRYSIVEIDADGNCLFRSLSDQLFRDHGNSHADVRSAVCDFMEAHEDDFSVFLVLEDEDEDASDFESYVAAMREDGEWGGNLELVAAARLYRRNITVFSANMSAMNINHDAKKSSGADLLLSYHDNDHYSSVRDNSVKSKSLDTKKPSNNDDVKIEENTKKKKKHNKDASDSQSSNKDAKQQQAPPPKEPEPIKDTQDEIDNKSNKDKKESRGPTKQSPCPCGSGRKYKKCCWAKEKHEARIRKMKGASDESSIKTKETEKEEPETFEMNGNFRVLQI